MEKFKCNCCGKEHGTLVDMARCILACSEKIKREEEQKRKVELEKERKRKEIDDMFSKLVELTFSYNKEYGSIAPIWVSAETYRHMRVVFQDSNT